MTAPATVARERPILFSAAMVRAILDGCKTQTRRVILQRLKDEGEWYTARPDRGFTRATIAAQYRCPYGEPGDRLWVRETWCPTPDGPVYRATDGDDTTGMPDDYDVWKPSIHMPRWACRLTLRVTEVRVERVQDVSEEDAQAEGLTKRGHWWDVGADWSGDGLDTTASGAFRMRWDDLNAKRGYGWDMNPWVWVVSFERGPR